MLFINKAQIIFSYFDKYLLIKLSSISIITMFLEIFSVVSIIPLITLLLNESRIANYLDEYYFLNFLKNYEYQSLIIFFLSCIFAIFFFKNFLLFFFNSLNLKIVFQFKKKLINLMCKSIVLNDYSFHLKNNSSKIFYQTISLSDQFVSTYVLPLSHLFSEIIVIIGLFILMIYIEPFATIITILSLLTLMCLAYIFQKKKITRLGFDRYEADKSLIKKFNQILLGIKDIILSNKSSFFYDSFVNSNNAAVETLRKFHVFQVIPRLLLEVSGITALIIFIIIMVYDQQASNEEILSSLSIFALCSFRFIPSINRIMQSLQNIKFAKKNVSEIFEFSNEFKSLKKNNYNKIKKKKIDFFRNIELKDISLSFNGKKILNNINLEIKKNSIIGIKGQSGSGKSTLVNIISGLIKPDRGQILFDGLEVDASQIIDSEIVSYLHQDPFILEDTLKKNIAFGLDDNEIDNKKLLDCIKLSQLKDFVDNLPDKLDSQISERGIKISGGQKQRIAIARTLYFDRKILILDEATSALDIKTESEIFQILHNLTNKITVIVISHKFNQNHQIEKKVVLEKGLLLNEKL